MPGTDIRVVDENYRDVLPGTVGEIICRSECSFRGYWDDHDLTEQTMPDGWLRTGDLGYLDDDGYLSLVGRKKEIIKSGGMTIIPAEIEAVLYQHPAVLEAAVVGSPDEVWGERVLAFVAVKPGTAVSPEELIDFCGERLAAYKKPRSVQFLASLPKTGIGKIARRALLNHCRPNSSASGGHNP